MKKLEKRARENRCDCDDTDCKMVNALLDEIDLLRSKNNKWAIAFEKQKTNFNKTISEIIDEYESQLNKFNKILGKTREIK